MELIDEKWNEMSQFVYLISLSTEPAQVLLISLTILFNAIYLYQTSKSIYSEEIYIKETG